MAELNLKIDGMSCHHCVMRVKKAIDEVNGVKSSEVDVGSAKVVYDDAVTSGEAIEKAIEGVGYKIVS
jgi:copper chaperone CopZ